jgi:predicted nucleotide-binding protein (sugar kinase/HSP70/actin superfamily)
MVKVGIPQALLYWRYYPLWWYFFKEIGVEIVLSPKTNEKLAKAGIKVSVEDICYPVKVGFGHLIELSNYNNIDYIFVPYIISVEKQGYMCPKFAGFADVARASISNLAPLLTPCINVKKKQFLQEEFIKLGREISNNRPSKLKSAIKSAESFYQKFMQDLYQKKLRPDQAFPYDDNRHQVMSNLLSGSNKKIGLIGHPYNIYDTYINRNLIKKLNNMGIDILTPEMVNIEEAERLLANRMEKKIYWTLGREIIAAAYLMVEKKLVDGIIYLISFGCALDSLLQELVSFKTKSEDMPYMQLVIDEHTSEVGLLTRLEAFVEMLNRQ